MATTVSTTDYTGDGSLITYNFSFPYFKTEDVKVSLDGTNTTEFTLPTATSIQFNSAPSVGVKILIYRDTDVASAKAVFASGSAFRAKDLNNNQDQNLYAVQEINDTANPKNTSHFTQTGTGAVARTVDAKLKDNINVWDFIPVGTTTASTNCAPYFQAAIDTGKTVYVPKGTYRIDSTLTLNSNYNSLIGDECLPVLLKWTEGPAIEIVEPGGTGLNEFSRVENFYIQRKIGGSFTCPTYKEILTESLAGVVVSGHGAAIGAAVQMTRISNLRVSNFAVGFYFTDCVGVTVHKCFTQNQVLHTNASSYTENNNTVTITSSMWGVGYYFEATRFGAGSISPMASIEIVECDDIREGDPTAIKSVSYLIVGADPRDIFFQRAESTKADYGWYIDGLSNDDLNWDLHIIRPIIDAFTKHAIYANNLDGVGSLSITGGYFVGAENAEAAIYVTNSNGINISGGAQILGLTNHDGVNNTDDGIRLDNCSSCSIIGNRFANLQYAISLNGTTYSTIQGNVISAAVTGEDAQDPQLVEAIRLWGNSTYNTVGNNTIRGLSGSNKYGKGINLVSGSDNCKLIGNIIESTTVTTPIDDNASGTEYATGTTNLSYTAGTRELASSSGSNVTLPEATTSNAGLQSSSDKTKLDNIANYTNSLSNSVQRTTQSKLDDFVNILDFGVEEGTGKSNTVRTNNTSRFENALAHEKRIYIPAGTYEFNDEIDIENKTVTLFGDGERLSILSWETATGANGIHWSTDDSERTLTVKDLKLRTSAAKTGSPIYAKDTDTTGGSINPNVVIENVVAEFNGSTSRWQKGFHFEDCRNSYCNRVVFRGSLESSYQSDYGFLMDGTQIGCLDFHLFQCQVSDLRGDPGAAFLIRGACEGIHIESCLAINTDRGVQSDSHYGTDSAESGEPFVTVINCHFNVHEKGILLQRVLQSFISNNHIQACDKTNIGALVNWTGIEFGAQTSSNIKCENIHIHQNLFHAGFSGRNALTDKGAYFTYADEILVDNNQFKGCDDSVIEFTSSVTNSQALNNRFNNCDSPHITNNGSNVITEVTGSSGTTNLSATASGTALTVESSSGTNVNLPAATTSAWGVMSDDDKTNLDANTAKVTNATHTGDVTGSSALTIANNAVTTAKIADDAVTADKLANSINTEIAANTAKTTNATHTGDVTGATSLTIANDAVNTNKIADDAVTADKLANSINTEIAANTAKVTNATHTGDVTGATTLTIANDKIEEKHINAGGTPGADKVLVYDSGEATNWKWADQSGSGGVADGAVTTAKLADDAVTGAKIADAVITNSHLGVNCVTSGNISNDAINSEHYVDASIDHQHLSNDCIDGDNIQDDAINSEHYTDGSIDTAHIATGAITGSRIANDQVDNTHLADDAVGIAQLSATGTASSSTYLRGDNTWATVSGGGGGPGTGESYVNIDNHGTANNSGSNVYAGYRSGQSLTTPGTNENTFYGTDSGKSTTTAGYNTYIGHRSGENATQASNTAVGAESLRANNSGNGQNTAVGVLALTATTGGDLNTAVGHYALAANTSGSSNVAVGKSAGTAITTGDFCTAIGTQALETATDGNNNTAIGSIAMQDTTTGQHNTAVGRYSLTKNTSANFNASLGYSSLYTNTTGANNTGLGAYAGNTNSTSHNNTAVGFKALYANTAANNTALGYQAGDSITTGSNLTCIGYEADASAVDATNEITLGNADVTKFRIPGLNFTLKDTTATDNYVLTVDANGECGWEAASGGGPSTGESYVKLKNGATLNDSGSNTMAGVEAGNALNASSSENTLYGYRAGKGITAGKYNNVYGLEALESAAGDHNCAFGKNALQNCVVNQNVAVGNFALKGTTYNTRCVAVGYHAASSATDAGSLNPLRGDITAVGWEALKATTTAGGLTAVGSYAGHTNTTGASNTYLGYSAGRTNSTSSSNTAIGYYALYSNTAASCTAVGNSSMSQSTGANNTALGASTGSIVMTGTNNTLLGYGANPSAANANNEITLGNASVTKFRIPGLNFSLKDTTATEDYVLTVDANGDCGWEAAAGGGGGAGTGETYVKLFDDTASASNSGKTTVAGYQAGAALANDGKENTFFGYDAGKSTTSGEGNVYIGQGAGDSGETASYCVAVGRQALNGNTTNNNTAVGAFALDAAVTGAGNTAVGRSALSAQTSGTNNTAVGIYAGDALTSATDCTFLGRDAGGGVTTGNFNIAIGAESMMAACTGTANVVVGRDGLRAITSGEKNVALGNDTNRSCSSGNNNVAIGHETLFANDASDNVGVGFNVLKANTSGVNNVAAGTNALLACSTGGNNVALGHSAGDAVTTGSHNISLGRNAGGALSTTNWSIFIGADAGSSATGQGNIGIGGDANRYASGNYNTVLGHLAGDINSFSGENNTIIGNGADPSAADADNEITLGNSSIATLRCQVTSISSLSDRRDKTDINTLDLGLDFVNSLKPVKFKWDSREGIAKDGSYEAGFIAQDFQQVQKDNDADYLNLVLESNPEKLEAAPGKLIPILVKAIQELKQEIELLKTP